MKLDIMNLEVLVAVLSMVNPECYHCLYCVMCHDQFSVSQFHPSRSATLTSRSLQHLEQTKPWTVFQPQRQSEPVWRAYTEHPVCRTKLVWPDEVDLTSNNKFI